MSIFPDFRGFLPQRFFKLTELGDEAVADQQDQFIRFVFIVDVRRGITLFQHHEPNRGIIDKAELVAELKDLAGRAGLRLLSAVKPQDRLQGFPRKLKGQVELTDHAGAVYIILIRVGKIRVFQHAQAI